MCGRFTLVAEPEARFVVNEIPFPLSKRFNIAPTQQIAVIQEINGIRTVAQMRWGLVPFWATDLTYGKY
jgi:putative SOS response-associated peptidase YedK